MRLPKTRSMLLWRNALRDIQAAGRTLDPEEMVWLWTLAERVRKAPGRRLLFRRAPIVLPAIAAPPAPAEDNVRRVVLYPITVEAVEWLLAVSAWWIGSDLIPSAFACAHSDGLAHAVFDSVDRVAIKKEVDAWMKRLSVSPAELKAAVRIQTNSPDSYIETEKAKPGALAPDDLSAEDYGELLALSAGAYHVAPWELLKRPFADLEAMIDRIPVLSALYGATRADPDNKSALDEFQAAVIFLKSGGAIEGKA